MCKSIHMYHVFSLLRLLKFSHVPCIFIVELTKVFTKPVISCVKCISHHSDGASRLSNSRTVPSPQPAINSERPKESEARLVTQLSAPVGISYKTTTSISTHQKAYTDILINISMKRKFYKINCHSIAGLRMLTNYNMYVHV